MVNKVSFKEIDKLGNGNILKALWKGFLFHYFNHPKIILLSLIIISGILMDVPVPFESTLAAIFKDLLYYLAK
ncbi:MAG: hypothetical protein B7X86_14435 [Sphingobacteriales bacterium 17-39-43]|nr:MAG: hypothetical protein B7Y24_14200 [Sphingobacteriales bacterium 16-39-50]OZA22863.1 MAG: hypothetical protein B7X86_14435 [Sphingobacteriales bacterium 17-39-43]